MPFVIFFWAVVFIISLFVLVKGADYLIEHAEKIGLSYGLSPFIIGVVIIGIGTSLPELTASIAAIIRGATEIVVANAVGSNIANILLVLGITAIITNKIEVEKNLIYLDLPILLSGTILFLGVAVGRELIETGEVIFAINWGEALFLVVAYLIYLAYSFLYQDGPIEKIKQLVQDEPDVTWKNYAMLGAGAVGVILGAKFTIDATIALSENLNIAVGIISIFAIALGTSLPELFVSYRAAQKGKPEIAVGNIFGSNIFNILMLVGLPGLFSTLRIDDTVIFIGLPVLFMATLIFVISGISNKVHRWDGAMYLMLYVLFIAKLFNIF